MRSSERPRPARLSPSTILAAGAALTTVTLGWARPTVVHAPAAPTHDEVYEQTIAPIFEATCVQCHGPLKQKGAFRLDELDRDFVAGEDAEEWDYILDVIRNGDMPPSSFERQLSSEERAAVTGWIEAGLEAAARAKEDDVRPVLRRLNRAQYRHTLQELLQLPVDFGQDLPGDAKSKMGFTNNGATLQASTLHLETYQAIARRALDEAIAPGPRPESTIYRVRFGEGIGRGKVGGRTGGYQSVILNPDQFTVEIIGANGEPKGEAASSDERKALDAIRKKISVGLRGSQQNRFHIAADGLVLYGAVPHKEKAPGAWQGPSPNAKLELQRVFPERGDLVMRVSAARGGVKRTRDPVLLKLEDEVNHVQVSLSEAEQESETIDGEEVEVRERALSIASAMETITAEAAKSDQRKNVRLEGDVLVAEDVTQPADSRVAVQIPAEGFYRVHLVHPPVPVEQMPSVRLSYAGKTLDSRPEMTPEELAQERVSTVIGAAYMRAGRQHLKLGGPFFIGYSHVVLTPLAETHPLAAALGQATADLEARFDGVDPVLRAYAGTRTDDGMDYSTFDGAAVVTAPRGAPETYTFVGRLENLPIPEPESGDNEILSGILLLGVWNDHLIKDRRSPGPPLLVEQIEVEAPFHPVWPPASHTAIFPERGDRESDEAYAERVLVRFMSRAFRRAAVAGDAVPYLAFFREVRPEVDTFEDAIKETLIAVLCSPRFLFLVEGPGERADELLSPFALANRLSYFLWNGPPDEALRNAALFGTLDGALEAHVDRMLDDPRARRFVDAFATEWLRLDRLEDMTIDADRFPKFTRFVKRDMREETLRFVHRVFAEDLDVMTLVDSDFAMLNQNLAEFYGVADVVGPHFRPVVLPRSEGRGGLMSQGAFLAGHSDGLEPHPIKRAVWVKEKLLGSPPPPPPPNVPDLDAEAPEMKGLTLKEQLELHRDNPSCHDCHASFDPFGVALERYNAVGLLETQRKGRPIDASVALPDGTEIDGAPELKAYLAGPARERFMGSVVEHLFAYALGRDLVFSDDQELEAIARETEARGGTGRALLRAIVTSPSFRQ